MSEPSEKNPRPASVRVLLFLGPIVALALVLLLVAWLFGRNRETGDRIHAQLTEKAMVYAMKTYATEYGRPVSGSPQEILAALSGQNERQIVFFQPNSIRTNALGELIDPWGVPYRFDLSKPEAPRIWSCGPNRKDEGGAEGSDDIVSWR